MTASRIMGWAAAGCFLGLVTTASQAGEPCSETADLQDAGISILRCGSVIVAAEATAVRSPASTMSSHQGSIQLDAGAIAVSAESSAAQFSALTPDAVVSGRDGEWIIVAEAGRTRAAVLRGTVISRLRIDGSQKILRPGDAGADALDRSRSDRLALALHRARTIHP
jgi:hypothetical protein